MGARPALSLERPCFVRGEHSHLPACFAWTLPSVQAQTFFTLQPAVVYFHFPAWNQLENLHFSP